MSNMLKKVVELWIQKRFLALIEREVQRHKKLEKRLIRQGHMVIRLADRYNELYPNNPIGHYEMKDDDE